MCVFGNFDHFTKTVNFAILRFETQNENHSQNITPKKFFLIDGSIIF